MLFLVLSTCLCGMLAAVSKQMVQRQNCWKGGDWLGNGIMDTPEAQRRHCCDEWYSEALTWMCFDSTYTREECCGTDHAILFLPKMPPVPNSGSPVTRDKAQREWEYLVRNATFVRTVRVGRSPSFSLRYFKRWHVDHEFLMDEQQSDAYNLDDLPRSSSTSRQWAVDVGANLGIVTLQLLKSDPFLNVLAIEPSPSVFRYLLWNLRANNVADRCIALNVGISNKQETAILFEPLMNPIQASLLHRSVTNVVHAAPRIQVPVMTFEQALGAASLSFSDVGLVKVDCEGCEWSILDAAAFWRDIDRFKIALVSEIHHFNGVAENPRWTEMTQQFCSEGISGKPLRQTDSGEDHLTCARNHYLESVGSRRMMHQLRPVRHSNRSAVTA